MKEDTVLGDERPPIIMVSKQKTASEAAPAPGPPAQAAQGAAPAAPSSVFQTLPTEGTVAVSHQPPHVGLQNTTPGSDS